MPFRAPSVLQRDFARERFGASCTDRVEDILLGGPDLVRGQAELADLFWRIRLGAGS